MPDEMAKEPTAPMDKNPSQHQAQEPDLTGKTIGDFRLLRRLGQGGMGQVYLAEQVSLKRKVAVKMLRTELAANETALKRFEAEALAVARLTHANIVQVYDAGEKDGLHYMALEYVEGRNLRDYLQKKGPPDVLVCISIIAQVAAALQRASELGIVHRDIKPENILITRKDEVKVTDFGLSRILIDEQGPLNLTQSGVTMGTPLYMSPEQVEGKKLDPRTDIYSLGVTAYHMLAGQPPFHGQSAFEVAVQHVQKEPIPLEELRPDLPAALCSIVQKMMAKRPEDRYQTAQEIVRDLGQLRDVLVGVSSTMPQIMLATGPKLIAKQNNSSGETEAMTAPAIARKKSGKPWLAVAAIIFMLIAGIGLGRLQRRANSTISARDADRISKELAQKESNPLDEDEKMFVKLFKDFDDPEVVHDPRKGIDACIDLGLFYLKHRDHKKYADKAEQFFNDLAKRKGKQPYRYFGQLGQAMVLAFQGETKASNAKFMEILSHSKKRPFPARQRFAKMWMAYWPLRKMVAEALNHNLENMQKDNPDLTQFEPPFERLEKFRRPPPPTLMVTQPTIRRFSKKSKNR